MSTKARAVALVLEDLASKVLVLFLLGQQLGELVGVGPIFVGQVNGVYFVYVVIFFCQAN